MNTMTMNNEHKNMDGSHKCDNESKKGQRTTEESKREYDSMYVKFEELILSICSTGEDP